MILEFAQPPTAQKRERDASYGDDRHREVPFAE